MKASDEAQPQRKVTDVHREEIIIVGSGQAGLSMGYWLKQQQRSFLLLEAGPRIGESWRKRYDSLVLFTPRRYNVLPGLALSGDPEGRPTKNEIADYLQTYADHFALPIQMDTRVVGMEKHEETFMLQTKQGPYQAMTVIVATGPFHYPRIPAFASAFSPQVEQLHSASYDNPSWSWEQAIPARILRRNWPTRIRCLWLLAIRCTLSHSRCWAKASSGIWIPCASWKSMALPVWVPGSKHNQNRCWVWN
jgi:hypothetical protein